MSRLIVLGTASTDTRGHSPHSVNLDGIPLDEEGVLYPSADVVRNPDDNDVKR